MKRKIDYTTCSFESNKLKGIIFEDAPLFQQKALPNEIRVVSEKTRLRRKLEDYLRKYATESQLREMAKQWGIEL